MPRGRIAAFVVVAVLCTLSILLDYYFFVLPEIVLPLDGALSRTQDKAIDVLLELAKLFVTFALGILAAISFLVRGHGSSLDWNTYGFALMVTSAVGAVMSIYFGHVTISLLIEMLAYDFLSIMDYSMIWAVRLQYFCVLISIVALLFLVIEVEVSRR